MAYRLAGAYAGHLLHVHGLGWHYWTGTHWTADDGDAVSTRAVLVILSGAASESVLSKDKDLHSDVRRCESSAGIRGVLTIAATLIPFSHTVDDLNADPYLLNTASGTLDLRTMELRDPAPADLITMVTRGAYRPDAAGPVWKAHLEKVLPDVDVRGFLQRYVGLGVVGIVIEHVLAILTGNGRNGKGSTYGAIAFALGDYASTAEPDLFMARDRAHPTGEMDLLGKRWVVVSESDKGRRLAEATVKRLTGGDMMKARKMHRDFVEFRPSHTVALVTNHLPKVSGDDEAIWARLRIVPFDVTLPDAEQDGHFAEKLELEADAVLTWAVQGWAEYQQVKLNAPEAVTAATQKYRSESDTLAQFIAECCITGVGYSAGANELRTAYVQWCGQDEDAGTAADFRKLLEDRGHKRRRTAATMRYGGIGILDTEPES